MVIEDLPALGRPTNATLSFDLRFEELSSTEAFTFLGDLTIRASGNGEVLTGNLSVDFDDLGALDVAFEEITTDANGNFIGGSLLFDATDSGIEGVVGIRVGFVPSTVVPVSVIFDDQSQLDFNFDTISGDLTPIAN